MKMGMFLCFHVNFKHESTKKTFSAYFYPPFHHNGKGFSYYSESTCMSILILTMQRALGAIL